MVWKFLNITQEKLRTMNISFCFDDQLDHLFIATFKDGWTWEDYHIGTDAFLNYPPNLAIPAGVRVDQIVDWRDVRNMPRDGVGSIHIARERDKVLNSPYDIPRNGGMTVYIGNPIFVPAMLKTFGLPINPRTIRTRVMPTIEAGREAIRQDRALAHQR